MKKKMGKTSEKKRKERELEENKWKNLYKKALADMVHLEQKMKVDMEHLVSLSQKSLLLSLLEVLDDIENISTKPDSDIHKAVALVKDKLMNILSVYGVTLIKRSEGDKVDPTKDEIVGVVVGKRENVIQKIVRKGYLLNDVILRPVRVIVEKKQL